jgi:hypothetical protein
MSHQLTMALSSGSALENAFWAFHARHPEVYRHLRQFAWEWKARGRGPLGIAALYERVRWEIGIELDEDEEPPRLNNNHRAYYARLLMQREPELIGTFQLRQQQIAATFGPANDALPSNEHLS